MKEIFSKNKTLIFRTLGGLMFVVGFMIYFWSAPKQGLSENEKAARNIARMQASIAGGSSSSASKAKPSHVSIMESYKDTQAKQMRYLLILTMLLGSGFLGYSFIKKKEDA